MKPKDDPSGECLRMWMNIRGCWASLHIYVKIEAQDRAWMGIRLGDGANVVCMDPASLNRVQQATVVCKNPERLSQNGYGCADQPSVQPTSRYVAAFLFGMLAAKQTLADRGHQWASLAGTQSPLWSK